MSSGFVQCGGWWVAGQFLLLLAVAILGITARAASARRPIFICGLILLAASAVCGVCGLIALGRNLTPFPRPSGATQFVRLGIYARIRHPLYTTVFCVAMGWSLLGPSWPALAVSLVLGIFLDAKARHEERWLRR